MKAKVQQLGKVAITVEKEYWNKNTSYDRLVVVEEKNSSFCYLSRIPVPAGEKNNLNDREYWICIGKRSINIDLSGFVVLQSVDDLPTEATEEPYLVNGIVYYYVGTGGNVKDGLYQSWDIRGPKGDDGLSAYELYVEQGGEKTLDEWLATEIKGEHGERGAQGDSAYEIWLNYMRETTGNPDFSKPVESFINYIKGDKGDKGDPFTYNDFTQQQLAGLIGPPGAPGVNGKDGKPGPPGAAGADGADGYTPYIGPNGNWFINETDTGSPSRGIQGATGATGASGANGANGKSAYESYVEVARANGEVILTEEAWIQSLGQGSGGGGNVVITDTQILIYVEDGPEVPEDPDAPKLTSPVSGQIVYITTRDVYSVVLKGVNLTKRITATVDNPVTFYDRSSQGNMSDSGHIFIIDENSSPKSLTDVCSEDGLELKFHLSEPVDELKTITLTITSDGDFPTVIVKISINLSTGTGVIS